MADKNVLRIPVDTEAWDAFVDKFMSYQKLLDGQDDKWAHTNMGVKQLGMSFDKVESSFDTLVKAATAPKLSDKSSGAFALMEKSSKATASHWHGMTRDLEKSSKYFSDITRSGLKWESIARVGGVLGAGLGLVGGVVAGAEKVAGDLASQNKYNRAYSLKPGQATAFENSFGPAGGSASLIQYMGLAKHDTSKWQQLLALGFTPDQIMNGDAESNAETFMQRAGATARQLGPNAGGWAQQTGIDQLMDVSALNLAGSYDSNWYAQQHQRYETELPKDAQTQSALDAGTRAKADFDQAWTQLDTAFEGAAAQLLPDISTFVTEAADWVTAFAGSKEFKDDVDLIKTAFHDVGASADFLAGTLNHLFGLDKSDAHKGPSVEKGGLGDKILSFMFGSNYRENFQKYNKGETSIAGGDQDMWDFYLHGSSGNNLKPSDQGYESSLLNGISDIESGGDPNAYNPKTGAAGMYGIMPANAVAFGIDPKNPVASRAVAQRIYEQQFAKYHNTAMALGGYDGDTHIAEDQKKMGNWLYGAPQETLDYLRKMELWEGVDIHLSATDQAYLEAHTHIKPRKGGAKGSGGGLDPNPQIVAYDGGNPDDIQTADSAYAKSQMQNYGPSWDEFTQYFRTGGGAQFAGGQSGGKLDANPQIVVLPATVKLVVPPGYNSAVSAGQAVGGY